MSAMKLRPYFESHPITVRTNYPIKTVLWKPEITGGMAKWSIQLSAYNIHYEPKTTIKSQALTNFVFDFTPRLQIFADKHVKILQDDESTCTWTLYTNGVSNNACVPRGR